MRFIRWTGALLFLISMAAQAQPVTVTWPLNAGTLQNPSPTPPTVTTTPQQLSPGMSPAMSIFDYWPSNTPQGQRLFAGTAGWTAGAASPGRFIQFDVAPNPGTQLTVTAVSFNYGGAQGAPQRMKSEVRYSTDNTNWILLNPALDYPTTTFNGFGAPLSIPPIPAGQKFSLRIHPYAVVTQTAASPLFAAHHGVTIQGVSAPAASAGAPDLHVTKICSTQGQANNGVLCVVSVKNNGTVPSIAPLVLTDVPTGPANAVYTGAGGQLPISCTPGAGPLQTISCKANASIPPGASQTALFSFQLPTGGTLNNCASVSQPTSPGMAPDPNPGNNTNVCTSVTVGGGSSGGGNPPAPDLGVIKTCVAQANQSVLCTVQVRNNSNTTASLAPLTISDIPTGPPGTTYTGAGGSMPVSCSTGAGPLQPINCTVNGSIAPGATQTALFSFKLPPAGGVLGNCVTVTQPTTANTGPEANLANNTNICTKVSVPGGGGQAAAPDLGVIKTCVAQANQSVLCTVQIRNNSNTTASLAPLSITDLPQGPPGTTYTGAGGSLPVSCTTPAGPLQPINCTANGSIAPGDTQTALFSFKLPPQGGVLANCATVTQPTNSSTGPEANLGNNTNICTKVSVPGGGGGGLPDLSVGKTCAVVGPNRLVRCTINVMNNGSTPTAAPWSLQETITGAPPGTQLVSVGAAGIACTGVSLPMPLPSPMNCQLHNPVVPGTPYVILVDFRLPQPGKFNNCAVVSQTGGTETNVANNTGCTGLAVP